MIGVFDSGFGGLTILSALFSTLPEYDFMYLGDSARAPYGNHSRETITRFTREGVEFLFKKGAKLVILACNTASANSLRTLQEELIRKPGVKDRNVLGVVIPIAEAIAATKAKKIALIGTRATISSGTYEEEIQKRSPNTLILKQACPLLVPLIEEGWAKKMETRRILKSYLRPLKDQNPDILVPACTHYPILQKEMERMMGKRTQVLCTGEIVAKSLQDYLLRHPELEKTLQKTRQRHFWTTDTPEKFQSLGQEFLSQAIPEVHLTQLGT